MLSLPALFRRRRQSAPLALRTLDVGTRIVTLEVKSAVSALARARDAIDDGHPHRAAALDLVSDAATRALRLTSGSARNEPPPRLTLIVDPLAIRIEARGAGIDGVVRVGHAADHPATRWGFASGPAGPMLWYAFGEPIGAEESIRS